VYGHVVEPEAHRLSPPPCRDVTPGNDPRAPCGPNPNCGPVLVTAIRRITLEGVQARGFVSKIVEECACISVRKC
jgi:hypothetical protein